jgi:hypothetical protein
MNAKTSGAARLALAVVLSLTSAEGCAQAGGSVERINATAPANADQQVRPPVEFIDTAYTRASGKIIRLSSSGNAQRDLGRDLQRALDDAVPGDVIELDQKARFVGNFVLPRKPAAAASGNKNWIIIRSAAADTELPAPGERVSPSFAGAMPDLVSPNSDPVLKAGGGAHHFRLIGIELIAATGVNTSNLVRLGEGDERDASLLPRDIIIDRCYIHGDEKTGLRRGIALNSARTAVIDSWISDCHLAGADSQAICGWNGPGPFKIVNNYLEAAGENVMFGGADPRIDGLIPSDIEFRGNHCFKPLKWKSGHPEYQGIKWSVKNLFELKNARRVLIEGNVFENNWLDAQTGYAILFKSVNQEGKAPWSATEDVEFKNNVVRHCGGGINIQGTSPDQPGGRTSRLRIANNLFDDVNGKLWGGDGAFIKMTETPNVTVDHNTVSQSGNIVTAYGPPSEGFVFTNNIVRHNEYGVKGDGTRTGADTLARYFPGCVFRKNAIVDPRNEQYPADNFSLSAGEAVTALAEVKTQTTGEVRRNRRVGTDGREVGCDIQSLPSVVSRSGN